MKKVTAIVCLALTACTTESKKESALPPAPETTAIIVSETIFGKQIDDPYRYLENLKDPEVEKWYRSHSERSRAILDAIKGREGLIDKMKEFDTRQSTRVFDLSITDNDRYFYLKQTPDDETGKLFFRDGFNGDEALLFDPETFDGTGEEKYVINEHFPSPDGSKIAIQVAPNGSENSTIIILDVASRKAFPEKIDRLWISGCSWLPDNNSFLFNRLNTADLHDIDREKNSKVFLHSVGTDPAIDKEILSRATNPELDIREDELPMIDYDSHAGFMFLSANSVDRRMKVWYAPANDLNKTKISWKKLFALDDEVHSFTATDQYIYAFTPKDAPRYKIIRVPVKDPDLKRATLIVPEHRDEPISDFVVTSESLFYATTKNGVTARLFQTSLNGESTTEIQLPIAAGSVFPSSKGFRFADVWVGMSGWITPSKNYRYLPTTKEFKLEMLSSQAEYPEYADLVVEELMVRSHDGVEVPLSLIYKKGLKRDGTAPVFLTGYGSYGYSYSPYFDPAMLLWTENGAVFAVAHVRGGGELGNEWHKAGQKTTKRNTWKDVIATAEFLLNNKYAGPGKIVLNGASAGGILVGKAMTERPDLFAAVIPEVGCMNPLRGEYEPNGPINIPEFGTVKDSLEFLALLEMDAYLDIKDGEKYPAALITGGMNDPRVIAWQPGKFAARLTAANTSDKPIIFFTDFDAGHGLGNTKSKQFESLADILAFAFWQTGHPEFKPGEIKLKDPTIKLN